MRAVALFGVIAWAAVAGAKAQDTPAAPSPVGLTLRLADGRRQFRPGETIPIVLEFSSTVPDRFLVDGATYDRSGRLTLEDWTIEPNEAVVDPLLDYFGSIGGFIGGGIRSMNPIGAAPVTVRLELNDWFRFDTPGTYRLSATSQRVTDDERQALLGRGTGPSMTVASNIVEFEIVARDRAWEEAALASAVRTLETGASNVERRGGCRALRFLGTDAAIDEMVRRFGDGESGCDFDYTAGLFGAPNRARVVAQLTAGLDASDRAVNGVYVRTLAVLSLLERHSEFRAAQTREAKGGPPRHGELARRQELVQEASAVHLDRLAAALPQKTGRARAVSLLTLVESPHTRNDRWRDAIAAAFLDLPPERQASLLEFQWRTVASPRMLPVVRALADRRDPAGARLADVALRRLYELDLAQARPLIEAAIRNPPTGATVRTLGLLPDAELPRIADVLASALQPDLDYEALSIRAELLERYGTPAAADAVLARVRHLLPTMACRPKHALIAYLLRAQPATGRSLLDEAMAARSETGCYKGTLMEVATLHMAPAIETAATVYIDEADPEVAANAIRTLGEFGSPAARSLMRDRFERWSRTWKGREQDLRYRAGRPPSEAAPAGVERAFVEALGRGRAWLSGPDDIRELHALCVSDSCRQEVKMMLDASANRTIRATCMAGLDDCTADVAQYHSLPLAALERKLSQFPRGTAFRLDVGSADGPFADAIAERIATTAARHGVTVAR